MKVKSLLGCLMCAAVLGGLAALTGCEDNGQLSALDQYFKDQP